jgi:hypothetical protein
VNAFIDAIGKDVNAAVVPRVEALAHDVGAKALNDYVPRISAFANQIAKAIIDEQSIVIRDFATALIQDLSQRYRPELAGEIRTHVVQGGLQLTGQGVRLDLKRRDTGTPVASLDIPVSITIKLDALALNIQDATFKLDVV